MTTVVVATTAAAGVDDYPTKWRNVPQDSVTDTWGYPNRECTSFVAWRLHERNHYEVPHELGGASTWQEALDENGESVHHLAFWVEGMQTSVDFLKERGVPLCQRGDMGAGQYAYFDSEERLGVNLELLERTRASRDQP